MRVGRTLSGNALLVFSASSASDDIDTSFANASSASSAFASAAFKAAAFCASSTRL